MLRAAGRSGIVSVIVAGCAAALIAGFAVARPNVVERWSIYASATGGPRDSYPVFLGPFPTAFSCDVEARVIVRNGGHAYCKSHRILEFGTQQQELLLAEFWPASRWIALCESRFRGRSVRQPLRPFAQVRPAIKIIGRE